MALYRGLAILHTALAAFFFPVGVMYAITGGLYGLDLKGNYRTTEHALELSEPLSSELSILTALVEQELNERLIPHPSGGARVRKGGTSYYLEWTGTRRDIELHPTNDPLVAQLKIKETDPHRFFVQLHKAKGGDLFKFYAAGLMAGLVGLFLTGGLMALSAKAYRPVATLFFSLGLVTFLAMLAIN